MVDSRPQHDGYAVASLILSLMWIGGLGSVIGFILGAVSESNAKRRGEPKPGLAVAGQWLGAIGVVIAVFWVIAR
jgi:hypothetical protein